MRKNELITVERGKPGELAIAGQVANHYAAAGVFADYLERKSANTRRRHRAALALFADYLAGARLDISPDALQYNPEAWQGMTWGIVSSFREWMLVQGYAIASINNALSVVKRYAALAFQAGAIDDREAALIRSVRGYGHKDGKHIDESREVIRRGAKKAAAVGIDNSQARKLKNKQPDTPQGRRDALLMCLLLDHGLRCGEVAQLEVSAVNLKEGTMTFYRPKVDKTQTHKFTGDTLRAVRAWFESGDAPAVGRLLRGSRKGGALTGAGMSERAITRRVRTLGRTVELAGLSAHDCRHYWATRASRANVDVLRLMQAGGWSSPSMPARYVEAAEIANEGMPGVD